MATPESVVIWVTAHGLLYVLVLGRSIFARMTGA